MTGSVTSPRQSEDSVPSSFLLSGTNRRNKRKPEETCWLPQNSYARTLTVTLSCIVAGTVIGTACLPGPGTVVGAAVGFALGVLYALGSALKSLFSNLMKTEHKAEALALGSPGMGTGKS